MIENIEGFHANLKVESLTEFRDIGPLKYAHVLIEELRAVEIKNGHAAQRSCGRMIKAGRSLASRTYNRRAAVAADVDQS